MHTLFHQFKVLNVFISLLSNIFIAEDNVIANKKYISVSLLNIEYSNK